MLLSLALTLYFLLSFPSRHILLLLFPPPSLLFRFCSVFSFQLFLLALSIRPESNKEIPSSYACTDGTELYHHTFHLQSLQAQVVVWAQSQLIGLLVVVFPRTLV